MAEPMVRYRLDTKGRATPDERAYCDACPHPMTEPEPTCPCCAAGTITFHGYGSTCPDCVRFNYVAARMGWVQRGCRS